MHYGTMLHLGEIIFGFFDLTETNVGTSTAVVGLNKL